MSDEGWESEPVRGFTYQEVMADAVFDCLATARSLHHPIDDWHGFVGFVAEQLLWTFGVIEGAPEPPEVARWAEELLHEMVERTAHEGDESPWRGEPPP